MIENSQKCFIFFQNRVFLIEKCLKPSNNDWRSMIMWGFVEILRPQPDNSKFYTENSRFSTGETANSPCATDKFVLLEDIEQTYMGRMTTRTMERPVDKQTIDNLLATSSVTYCGLIIDGYGCNQYRYRRT